jgi:hypothetical protein
LERKRGKEGGKVSKKKEKGHVAFLNILLDKISYTEGM